MLLLDSEGLRRALPMVRAIEAMRHAYLTTSTGQTRQPERVHLELPGEHATVFVMPAYVNAHDEEGSASFAVKTVFVRPRNVEHGLEPIQGVVLAFDLDSGRCEAVLEGATLTAIRTGAGSGVATELLSRDDARSVAILGAGVQAHTQLEAVCAVRDIRLVKVWNRTHRRAQALASEMSARGRVPGDLRVCETADEAVRDADIICTATASTEPLFADSSIKPGAHINAVGSFRETMVEIPGATVKRSKIYVDERHAALSEAGDLIGAIREGLIREEHIIGEIGEVISGHVRGRTAHDEVTLFKSVGLAAQDAAAAAAACSGAVAEGIGRDVPWS